MRASQKHLPHLWLQRESFQKKDPYTRLQKMWGGISLMTTPAQKYPYKTYSHFRVCQHCGERNALLDSSADLVCTACERIIQRGFAVSDSGIERCRACGKLYASHNSYLDHLPCSERDSYNKRRLPILKSPSHFASSRQPTPKRAKPKPLAADVPHCKSCGSISVKILNRRGTWLHCNNCKTSEQLAATASLNVPKQRAEPAL
jgi:hypothetical protein